MAEVSLLKIEIGNNIREIRKRNGLTLKELASRVGITEATMQKYEAGKIKTVCIGMIEKIADALNVNPMQITNWGQYRQEDNMNELQIFNNENYGEIRTMTIQGEPWFVAADVCKALEIGDTHKAVERLDDDEKGRTSIPTLGGNQDMIIVNEPGLYSLVLGSRKPEAKAFKRWITHEVIPQIRKTGVYHLPQTYAEALRALADESERREKLEKEALALTTKIEEMKPKVTYLDTILQNPSTVLVTQIAKDYGLSAKGFNKLLKDLGIQYKVNGQWVLYSKYQGYGYTQSKTHSFERLNGVKDSKMNTEWSQKGRLFLYELLKKNGYVPMIETNA